MGRTTRFDDDDSFRQNKSPKHARNQRGQGMRIINRWSEEDVYSDDNIDNDDQYYANTSQYNAKENTNGY